MIKSCLFVFATFLSHNSGMPHSANGWVLVDDKHVSTWITDTSTKQTSYILISKTNKNTSFKHLMGECYSGKEKFKYWIDND